MNWDDLKILLALNRERSSRKAANRLGISNTTIIRRLELLEEAVGARLFDRTPDGFQTTSVGEQLVKTAIEVEDKIAEGERYVTGRDTDLEGIIKVALPEGPVHFMAESFAEFVNQYPRIQLDLSASNEPVDLARREADVALRVLRIDAKLPKDIVGIRLGSMSFGYYIHKDLLSDVEAGRTPLTIMSSSTDEPDIKLAPTASPTPIVKRHVMRGVNQMRAAILCKMGAGELPSIACSDTPEIVQLPGTESERYGYFWLLYHKDLRQSARIRAFFKHVAGLQRNWSAAWDTSPSTEQQPRR